VEELIIVLNNVSSPQRLIDTTKVFLSVDEEWMKALVVTRASGMAAQTGIPEASKATYKKGKPLIVLSGVKDAVELLKPNKVLIYHPDPESKDITELLPELRNSGRLMLVIDGSEGGPSRADLALGEPVKIGVFTEKLPAAAALALIINELSRKA